MANEIELSGYKFQYISCVGSICLTHKGRANLTNFNTSHVSVQ